MTYSTNTEVTQGAARAIDRNIRLNPLDWNMEANELQDERIHAMVRAGVDLAQKGAETDAPDVLHRLDKADTRHGQRSLQTVADTMTYVEKTPENGSELRAN